MNSENICAYKLLRYTAAGVSHCSNGQKLASEVYKGREIEKVKNSKSLSGDHIQETSTIVGEIVVCWHVIRARECDRRVDVDLTIALCWSTKIPIIAHTIIHR